MEFSLRDVLTLVAVIGTAIYAVARVHGVTQALQKTVDRLCGVVEKHAGDIKDVETRVAYIEGCKHGCKVFNGGRPKS
jgi:hypothetical protein